MNVLVVGVGSHRHIGVRGLRDAGHFLGVIDTLTKIPTELVDWFAWVDRVTTDSALRCTVASGIKWDALLCWDELSVAVAQEVGAALGIARPRMKTANFRDKNRMRTLQARLGWRTPAYALVGTPEEALRDAETIGWPVIVKPVDYGGSSGVVLARNRDELLAGFDKAKSKSATARCLVEEYLEGPEVSVETVTFAAGRHVTFGVTLKETTAPPYFIEVGHMFPAPLPGILISSIVAETHKVLDAFEMERGASHVEFKLTKEGPILVEAAGRLGGGYIPYLVSLSTGLNPYLVELNAVTGANTVERYTVEVRDTCAVKFLTSSVHKPLDEASRKRIRMVMYDLKIDPLAANLRGQTIVSNGQRVDYCILKGSAEDVQMAYGDVLYVY